MSGRAERSQRAAYDALAAKLAEVERERDDRDRICKAVESARDQVVEQRDAAVARAEAAEHVKAAAVARAEELAEQMSRLRPLARSAEEFRLTVSKTLEMLTAAEARAEVAEKEWGAAREERDDARRIRDAAQAETRVWREAFEVLAKRGAS